MLRTSDLDYDLPPKLVATHPVSPRDAARIMVVERSSRSAPKNRHVRDLPEILNPGDLLVLNRSRVIPARFLGRRLDTGGKVEGLYVASGSAPATWLVMLKARRFRSGAPIELLDRAGCDSGVRLTLIERDTEDPAMWHVSVDATRWQPGGSDNVARASVVTILDRIGLTPLPPYIRARRKAADEPVDDVEDRTSYQTVYASEEGSVAAPTAGLHFTPDLLDRLAAAGIARAEVTLHVGLGTFKPVETEYIEQHPMHAEWCSMPAETVEALRRTREAGGRVIAVGTTTARTLESFALDGAPSSGPLETRLLITPGYTWRSTDGLLTNFHLPRSTLMALVAAMLPGGVDQLKHLYSIAIARRYRFYSYGDAMLILP